MPTVKDMIRSEIQAPEPKRPKSRVALSRDQFTDEQLEAAGANASVKVAAATIYDFCGTIHFCTTYTTTCTRMDLDLG